LDPRSLLNAAAVRAASGRALDAALAGDLKDWTVDLDRLPATADFVAEVIRSQYPALDVPFHARWRHFTAGGRNLWTATARWSDPDAKARTALDLAITSVMLDAGAGPDWKYQDAASGTVTTRSEGLGVASLRTFESGAFARDPKGDPLKADDLVNLTVEDLAGSFQVSEDNPLVGLDGRAALLQRLGHQVEARPDLFAAKDVARPGGLYDVLADWAGPTKTLPARRILDLLLEALGPIWQNRLEIDGVPMGDTWEHPVLGLVPIHKLSQWLSYSLIEPLQDAGIQVVEIDGLTGLAEYRNGGLFIDRGVTILRHAADMDRVHNVSDPLVVGWRSLTVALLDRIAPLVRARLGVKEADFPLARVLEGGTWAAGRVAAREKRAGGPPPLHILSDGTVF
jgi:hypothetical protein